MSYFPSQVVTVRKTAATTRTATVALAADPDLLLPLTAGNWLVSGRIYINTDPSAGIVTRLVGTSVGMAPWWRYQFLLSTPPYDKDIPVYAFLAPDENNYEVVLPGSGLDDEQFPYAIYFTGEVVTVASSGTVGVSWAQETSQVINTSLMPGSWLEAERLT